MQAIQPLQQEEKTETFEMSRSRLQRPLTEDPEADPIENFSQQIGTRPGCLRRDVRRQFGCRSHGYYHTENLLQRLFLLQSQSLPRLQSTSQSRELENRK